MISSWRHHLHWSAEKKDPAKTFLSKKVSTGKKVERETNLRPERSELVARFLAFCRSWDQKGLNLLLEFWRILLLKNFLCEGCTSIFAFCRSSHMSVILIAVRKVGKWRFEGGLLETVNTAFGSTIFKINYVRPFVSLIDMFVCRYTGSLNMGLTTCRNIFLLK